jgi:predicted AAA+ superfamily ATPase
MSGQLINYTSISNSIGVSQPTVKKWMSLLETSGILFVLPPHYKNFKKRIVKNPKLYFADTGVLSFLLSIRNPDELMSHPLFGNIFETFIISELYKRVFHVGENPPLLFLER